MTTSKDITVVDLNELENSIRAIIEGLQGKSFPVHFNLACILEQKIDGLGDHLKRNYGNCSLVSDVECAYLTSEAMRLMDKEKAIYNHYALNTISDALDYLCEIHNPENTFMEWL